MEKKPLMTLGAHRDISKIITPKKDKRIQVLVDDSFHRDFKIACSKNGTTMTDITLELIQDWLKAHKDD